MEGERKLLGRLRALHDELASRLVGRDVIGDTGRVIEIVREIDLTVLQLAPEIDAKALTEDE